MCDLCPIRTQCATQALTAGTSLDGGHPAPASGVIQAGVICQGDDMTAWTLAQIAGVPLPEYEGRRRATAADHCTNCHAPMVRWTRDQVPEGYVMHHARGFCTGCRAAYTVAYPPSRRRRDRLQKITDRKRHTAPPRRQREVTIQLALFPTDMAPA